MNGYSDVPYTQTTTYDTGTSILCANDYANAQNNSGSCGYANRARLLFGYATPTSPVTVQAAPNCSDSPLHRCFDAIFRSYQPDSCSGCITPGEFSATNWYNGTGGLDAWALAAANYAAERGVDTCSTQTGPSASASREWEAPGDKYITYNGSSNAPGTQFGTYQNTYTFVDGYFFGWRDCINPDQDAALFRALTVGQWGTYAAFEFETPSVNYLSQTING